MAKETKPTPPEPPAPAPTPEPAATVRTFDEIHAAVIREKVSAGLTRDQAIEVVRAQLAHDAALAAR